MNPHIIALVLISSLVSGSGQAADGQFSVSVSDLPEQLALIDISCLRDQAKEPTESRQVIVTLQGPTQVAGKRREIRLAGNLSANARHHYLHEDARLFPVKVRVPGAKNPQRRFWQVFEHLGWFPVEDFEQTRPHEGFLRLTEHSDCFTITAPLMPLIVVPKTADGFGQAFMPRDSVFDEAEIYQFRDGENVIHAAVSDSSVPDTGSFVTFYDHEFSKIGAAATDGDVTVDEWSMTITSFLPAPRIPRQGELGADDCQCARSLVPPARRRNWFYHHAAEEPAMVWEAR